MQCNAVFQFGMQNFKAQCSLIFLIRNAKAQCSFPVRNTNVKGEMLIQIPAWLINFDITMKGWNSKWKSFAGWAADFIFGMSYELTGRALL